MGCPYAAAMVRVVPAGIDTRSDTIPRVARLSSVVAECDHICLRGLCRHGSLSFVNAQPIKVKI